MNLQLLSPIEGYFLFQNSTEEAGLSKKNIGYIKLWRGINDHPVLGYRNRNLKYFFIELLLLMSYQTGTTKKSIRKLEKLTGFPKSTVQRMLTKLEKNDMITVVKGKDCLIISVKNWYEYQSKTNEKNDSLRGTEVVQQVVQPVVQPHQFKNEQSGTVHGTVRGPSVVRYKEKEYKNNNNVATFQAAKPSKEKKRGYDDIDVELTNRLFELMKQNHDHITKTAKDSDFVEMRRINSIDKKSYESIKWIIEWSQQHDFWRNNILSVRKLRMQMDTLMTQAKAEKSKFKKDSTIRGFSVPTDISKIPVKDKELTDEEKERGRLIKKLISSGYRMSELKNLKSKSNKQLSEMLDFK